MIVSSNTVGSIAQYICNSGFDLVGDSTRVCLDSGEWSNEQPECKGQYRNVLEHGLHSRKILLMKNFVKSYKASDKVIFQVLSKLVT